jgi:hypothetical protein
MAKRPAAHFLHFLSIKYDVVISYDRFYRDILSGRIPASRNDKETRWLIDEADEPVIVEALDLVPAEPAPPVPNKRSRHRSAA